MNKYRIKTGQYTHKPNWKKRIVAITILSLAGIWAYAIVAYSKLYEELSINTIETVQAEEEIPIYDQICSASGGENCDVLYNLAKCESSLNPQATNWNTNGTFDLGLYQINSVHKDISPLDKLNLIKSTQWTNDKIKQGKLHIWVCGDKI